MRTSFVRLQPIRNPIIRWLVYSHVWLALGAAGQVWWTLMHVPDRNVGSRPIFFAFFGTIATYGFMRLMRAKGALAETVPLFSWVRRNRLWQWIMVLMTGTIAFISIIPLMNELIGILWWLIPVCLLYVLPFGYPERYFGLRAVPFLKVPLIGMVWAVVTVVLPLRSAGVNIWEITSLLLILRSMLLVMALTIAFDIRDSDLDPPGLRTMPQLFGDRGARTIAIAMMILCILIQPALLEFDRSSFDRMAFYLLPIAGSLWAISLIWRSHGSRPEIFFGFTIDGMLILIPILAWLGTVPI